MNFPELCFGLGCDFIAGQFYGKPVKFSYYTKFFLLTVYRVQRPTLQISSFIFLDF